MGRFIASDQVRSDAEIKAVIEGDATLDLDAAATIDGVQIASTDDVRTDSEIVAAVEASATLDLDASATIDGSGIVSDSDLSAVALDDLSDVSASSPTDQDVLTWDDGTSTWVAQAAGGGVSGDVSTSIELTRTTAVSTGADSIVIGNGASVASSKGIAIGKDSQAGFEGISIGDRANDTNANGSNNIVIGVAADTTPNNSDTKENIVIGLTSLHTGINARGICIGENSDTAATANFTNPIAIGKQTQATAPDAIAIGRLADATDDRAVAIGYQADATAENAIAIGNTSEANRTNSVVITASGSETKPLTRDGTRVNKLHHVIELRAAPNNGTPTEATSDGAAASATDNAARNVVVMTNGKVASFRLHMTAIQATTNDAAVYIVTGGVKCIAGTASIIGANTTTAYEDDASWDCTVTTSGNQLVVTCTADAGGASTWRGTLTLTYED